MLGKRLRGKLKAEKPVCIKALVHDGLSNQTKIGMARLQSAELYEKRSEQLVLVSASMQGLTAHVKGLFCI